MTKTTLFSLLLYACASFSIPALHAQQPLPEDHPKVVTAGKVFDDLIRAIGDGRTRPSLRLLPRETKNRLQVAWFVPQQNTVNLEERVYDLCASLGADSLDALAVLLGHELAHYYKDHGWVGDFGNGFADLEVGKQLREIRRDESKLVEFETEADYFGGFFGYIAGYNTLDIAPETLARIYAEYELDERIRGYPPLAERQEIARRSVEQLRRLVPVFEAGNRLLLIGRRVDAARCFDYIARTFPSREILNNAGVARALEAVSLFPPGELRFAYPFELDAETRLQGGSVERGDQPALRTRLLGEAREAFDKARQKDPAYATAYVNLACVADLQGEPEEAVLWARKAVRIARDDQPVSLGNALIVRGIALARSDPKEEDAARQDFAAATQGNPLLAWLNLGALLGKTITSAEPVVRERGKPVARIEKIAGFSALEYEAVTTAPDAIASLPSLDPNRPSITIYARQAERWHGWVVDTGQSAITFLETRTGYADQSVQGVSIGDTRTDLTAACGPATRLVAGRQGVYHVYEPERIVFHTGADDSVQGWMIYEIEE